MDKEIEKLETFINRNGYPMIRRCQNCIFWNSEDFDQKDSIGLCTHTPLHFAFTLEPSVFPMTKDFCLCQHHQFTNEEKLAQVCDKVMLKDILKKKQDIL